MAFWRWSGKNQTLSMNEHKTRHSFSFHRKSEIEDEILKCHPNNPRNPSLPASQPTIPPNKETSYQGNNQNNNLFIQPSQMRRWLYHVTRFKGRKTLLPLDSHKNIEVYFLSVSTTDFLFLQRFRVVYGDSGFQWRTCECVCFNVFL